jgi:hypothetical protein
VTFQGAKCPDQDGASHPFTLANYIEQVVYPVGEVNVGEPRLTEHGAVSHRRAVVGVAGGVLWPVSLGLDDYTGGGAFGRAVGKNAAQEIHGDFPGIPVVKVGA